VDFEWDEAKRQQVLQKHGVDLAKVGLIFDGPTVTFRDERSDYREQRFISIGVIAGVPYVVVHTTRHDAVRLISAWRAGRRRYEQYKASLARRSPPDA